MMGVVLLAGTVHKRAIALQPQSPGFQQERIFIIRRRPDTLSALLPALVSGYPLSFGVGKNQERSNPMRIRKILAASLGAVTLAAATAVLAAPSARADVGDVDLTFYNAHGLVDGTDQDVFANLTSAQCDTNQVPSSTASASVTNLTDETVIVGTSCSDTDWIVAGPFDTIDFSTGSDSVLYVIAPAGL